MANDNLSLAEKLAIDRTSMALDRTLLAWVRTSLNMIAFGFTIYKLLKFMNEKEGLVIMKQQTPRNIGLFLETLGTVCMLLVLIDYIRTRKTLYPGAKLSLWLNPNFIAASMVFLLGICLIAVLVFNLKLL
jgi:putative membrane protein